MSHTLRWLQAAALLALGCAAGPARAAVTNAVPWADSFEAYPASFAVAGTNGWRADQAAYGTVSTNPAVIAPLAAFAPGYPLPGETHGRVLQVINDVCNDVRGRTGSVVAVDVMAMSLPVLSIPDGDATRQYVVCVNTNGHLLLWHRNMTGGAPGVNEWLELGSPTLATSVWTRFTILHDYAHSLFQVRVNGGDPVTNAAGWTAGGVSQPGSWFYMVQTNGALSTLQFSAGSTNYMDDVVVTNRSVTWTGSGFVERAINDGRMDTGTVVVLRLLQDAFTGTNGDDLAADGRVTVSGLPSNLVAVARRDSDTQVTLSLAHSALQHESGDSVSNVSVVLSDAAFAFGAAWDVSGSTSTPLNVTFLDTPQLSYAGGVFTEAPANDGSLDSAAPMTVDLVHGTFQGTPGENLGTNAAKVTFTNLPAGLAGEVLMLNPTQLQVRLTGHALAHAAADSVTNVAIAFGDAAFETVPASSVFHATAPLSITFADPSVLSYAATLFREAPPNNGAVGGTSLVLSNKAFNATNGEDLVAAGKVAVNHLPAGLGLAIVVADAQDAALSFTGLAVPNTVANSVTNLAVVFGDTAFVGGNAAGVAGAQRSDLSVRFVDPVVITYSTNAFTELSGGMIDGRTPATVTISGDTFAGANGNDLVALGYVAVSNLPPGLTVQFRRDSDTQLTIVWGGAATANSTNDSVANVQFVFQRDAFGYVQWDQVQGYTVSGISVQFINDTGYFSVMPYQEPFESYANGISIAGTNGWSGPFPDAGLVTNDVAANAGVRSYLGGHSTLPVAGEHRQVLAVNDEIRAAVHTEGAPLAFLDFMMMPAPVQFVPDQDTNRQYAIYLNTNCQVVVWHRNTAGAVPTNEWLTLSGSSGIDTSRWTRFTVTHDYARHRFQVQVNEGLPIVDAAGWNDAGTGRPGPWFYMVQTNASLSSIVFSGLGSTCLDDVTLRTRLDDLFGSRAGAVFKFR